MKERQRIGLYCVKVSTPQRYSFDSFVYISREQEGQGLSSMHFGQKMHYVSAIKS